MSCPQTRPSNVNKHPGQIVRDANKAQRRTKEQVTAEKLQKQVQKSVRAEAEKKTRTAIAVVEDAMAIQQNAQMMGPPKLVRPRPKPHAVASSKSKTNQENSVVTMAQSLAEPATEDGQTDQPVRRKHQGLKMNFRDGVAANRKVSNSGVTIATSHSDTHVGSMVDDGKIRFSTNQKLAGVQDLEGLIPDWAEKVASEAQLKPSAPPSTHTSKTPQIVEFDADLDDDEYYEPLATQGGKDLVHLVEKPRNTSKGLKRPLPAPKEAEYAEQEEFELLDDSEAAGDAEEQYDDDIEMVDDDGCADQKSLKAEAIVTRRTSLMSVDISDSKIAGKLVKTEDTISDNPRTKIKKGKAKNSDLPSGALEQGQWRTSFLPSLMYWVGNSDYGWSIPENELESALEHIFNAVIHEWRAAFGSTAVSVLMAYFTSTPKYKTQEAREEYAEDQLQDCRFVYEDPDNEEQPGAFLSEYILRIFASHLSAISGKVRVDELVEFGKPGYLTALALAAAAAERALILVQSHLLIDSDPSSSVGKNHKILQTLNEATNKMSHTGTAFSSGNWETDTLAYMDSIKDLPHSRIQDILTRAEETHPFNIYLQVGAVIKMGLKQWNKIYWDRWSCLAATMSRTPQFTDD
ncbi:hypothetical protein F4604DRAFT_1673857 [Suillus subluteus]|nr:hypothetical protein F4604DRAFT_1673857 [Suillus subluteus]